MISNSRLNTFLSEIERKKLFKSYLKQSMKQYDIGKYKIQNLQISDIRKQYFKIVRKYEFKTNKKLEFSLHSEQKLWLISQLKIFVWIVICYSSYHEQDLSHISQKGWNFFTSVFYFKPIETLQYQILNLLKGEPFSKFRKWSQFQNILLVDILKDSSLVGKWNQISKRFFVQSGKKYYRKPQKCRQQWFNHLNPQISHEPWSIKQDMMLIQQVSIIGNKWVQISKKLGGNRTEHMVKNRYNAMLKKNKYDLNNSERYLNHPQALQNVQEQKKDCVQIKLQENISTENESCFKQKFQIKFQQNQQRNMKQETCQKISCAKVKQQAQDQMIIQFFHNLTQ